MACISQFPLKEIESPVEVEGHVQARVRDEREVWCLGMRCLPHLGDQLQESANALLCRLRHSKGVAREHRTAFFVSLIGEQVPKGLDAVDPQFLKVADNDAVIENVVG